MLFTEYVDDLLLMGNEGDCDQVRMKLKELFELVELGPVKYLLGVEVTIDRHAKTIFFRQEAYVVEILKRFHLATCNPAPTPEAATYAVTNKEDTREQPYREAVEHCRTWYRSHGRTLRML